jgi:hypothetical protein
VHHAFILHASYDPKPTQFAHRFQAQLIANSESHQWVAENTRKCGNCNAPFFKLEGCNHLVSKGKVLHTFLFEV